MKRRMNRRVFTGSLIGAGAALATGSRLIRPVRAQISPDWWLATMTGWAGQFLPQFRDDLNNGANPYFMDWHSFSSAALAIRGVEREFGLDQILESQYGIDGDATWATDWAYQEGGWDQFNALTSLGYSYLSAKFQFGESWDGLMRTNQQTSPYINGTGPMSSLLGDGFPGWVETPPKPAWSCYDADMMNVYPWYRLDGIENPYVPTLPTDKRPNPIAMINIPNPCSFLKWTVALSSIAIRVMKASGLAGKYPLYANGAEAARDVAAFVVFVLC